MINFVGRVVDQLRNQSVSVFTNRRISVCVS